MTPEDIVAVDADEAADIEYELRGRHNPIEHAGEPCGGGCCTCTRDGCDAMWALSLLTRERKLLAAAQERIAALEAELEIARSVVEIARAALAGSQGLGGEAIGSCMGCGGDIRLVNGEPGGPCPHCMPQANTEAETTAPECRDGWHAIRPGEGACICGENRMELLL